MLCFFILAAVCFAQDALPSEEANMIETGARRNLDGGETLPCDANPCLDGDDSSQCVQNIIDITCEGASGEKGTGPMISGNETYIADIPRNTRDVQITLSADVDIDLQLKNASGVCLAGYGCLNNYGEKTVQGMSMYFSGDDTSVPVSETIRIPHVTDRLTLLVKAYGTGQGNVTYEWSSISPCGIDIIDTSRTCVCGAGYRYDEEYGCRDANDPAFTVQSSSQSNEYIQNLKSICDGDHSKAAWGDARFVARDLKAQCDDRPYRKSVRHLLTKLRKGTNKVNTRQWNRVCRNVDRIENLFTANC